MNTLARIFALATVFCSVRADPSYVVAAPRDLESAPEWKAVVDALAEKHRGHVAWYGREVGETRDELRRLMPRHVCFVQRPERVSRDFVDAVSKLTRRIDDDPYTDAIWGILTGFDATNALRIARHAEPLTVRRVAGGTEFAMDMVEEGIWYDELKQFKSVVKRKGEETPRQELAPADTTEALVQALTGYRPDLFITSGHATERDWQIGYTYRNGYFKCDPGQLYGISTRGEKFPVTSGNPKVYLPIGNCLMGHIDDTRAMALAWMNSAGVYQMMGYTVPTWYGYAGWGCLDYFVEQPGRYTLAEAFFANHQALIWRLGLFGPEALAGEIDGKSFKIQVRDEWKAEGLTPMDAKGLVHDRDTVAFYGDPGWEARMADRPKRFDQTLVEHEGTWTFTIHPNAGRTSFDPVNRNGAQRGWRPFVQFFPERIDVSSLEVTLGGDLRPVITDNFILVPNPKSCDPTREYKVEFRAKRATTRG